jgi:hypothetical protein
MSQCVDLGPDGRRQQQSILLNGKRPDRGYVGLSERLTTSSNLSLLRMGEWETALNFGMYDKADISSLSLEQLAAFAKLAGVTPEYILDKISS